MEFFCLVVESHKPGHCKTKFCFGITAEDDQLRVPFPNPGIASLYPLFDLEKRVLHVTRTFLVNQIIRNFRVRKPAPKPGEIPSQKGRDNKQYGENQNGTRASYAAAGGAHHHRWIVAIVGHAGRSNLTRTDKCGRASNR